MIWVIRTLAALSAGCGVTLAALTWRVTPDWPGVAAKAGSALLLLLGVGLMVRVYRADRGRSGVRVSPWFATLFGDFASVVFAAAMAAGVIDWLSTRVLGRPSPLGELLAGMEDHEVEALHVVAWLGLLVGVPVLTFFTSALTGQRVRVDERGVATLRIFGWEFVAWADLQEVSVVDQWSVLGATAGKPKRLQTVLELTGEQGALAINEPSSRSAKGRLLCLLASRAPEDKRHLFDAERLGW